jgi:hypothetical protein
MAGKEPNAPSRDASVMVQSLESELAGIGFDAIMTRRDRLLLDLLKLIQ